MKKLFAAFLFAVGVGASVTASAGDWRCEYVCRMDRDYCLQRAGSDAEARQECYDAWESCWYGCGNMIP